jgi:hypothetical protein
MWVIQGDTLVELPDDAPVPPDSVPVEVPRGVREGRRGFRIEGRRLVVEDDAPERGVGRLSREEVERVREALHDGRI